MSIRDAIWSGMSRTHAIQGTWTALCLAACVAMHELAGLIEIERFDVFDRDATWQAFHHAWLQVAELPARPALLTAWLERTRVLVEAADQLHREALAN